MTEDCSISEMFLSKAARENSKIIARDINLTSVLELQNVSTLNPEGFDRGIEIKSNQLIRAVTLTLADD